MKKLTGYTPGPWEVSEGFIVAEGLPIADSRCLNPTDADDLVEMDANADLIAQAPTLYEENKQLITALSEIRRAVNIAVLKKQIDKGIAITTLELIAAALQNTREGI